MATAFLSAQRSKDPRTQVIYKHPVSHIEICKIYGFFFLKGLDTIITGTCSFITQWVKLNELALSFWKLNQLHRVYILYFDIIGWSMHCK